MLSPLTKRTTRDNSINRTAWLAFLSENERFVDGAREINGRLMTETQTRAIHRWRKDGTTPDIWMIDDFLVAVGIHLDEYFLWCAKLGINAWANEEPEWHSRELTDEDWKQIEADWIDPS
jgi:hypothetical protein